MRDYLAKKPSGVCVCVFMCVFVCVCVCVRAPVCLPLYVPSCGCVLVRLYWLYSTKHALVLFYFIGFLNDGSHRRWQLHEVAICHNLIETVAAMIREKQLKLA